MKLQGQHYTRIFFMYGPVDTYTGTVSIVAVCAYL